MTLTPSHTPAAAAAAAVTIPVLPGLPAGIDSTDVVVQMVRRAASPGFESWWRKAENVGFCANPIHLSGTDTFGRQHQVLYPLQQPPRRRVPVVLGSVCPRHLAARARRLARRTPRHAVHRRRAPAGVRHLDRTGLRGRAHHPRRHHTVATVAVVTIRAAAATAGVGMGNRCGAAPSTAIMMRVWVNPYAKTATTTPGTSCSPGTPPSCGGASPSPCADSWTATCGPWVKPPTVFASTT